MEINPLSLLVWSDKDLLVINKPAGLPTLPEGWDPGAPHLKQILEPVFGRLWVVHRLDKETSGILALARSAEAHRALNTQFETRQVSKIYHALVAGNPGWDERIVNLPLSSGAGHRHRTVVDPRRGKPALTHFRILERFSSEETGDAFSLIEARPETGRTHQIRVHLYTLGYTVLGDGLYGGAARRDSAGQVQPPERSSKALPITRLALHARSLEIVHPISGERLRFEAAYPQDLSQAIERLRSSP